MVMIFADALYWHTGQTVDWASTLTNNQNYEQFALKTFTFNWAPGYRIGLGRTMGHDQWDTQASYTWFHSKASDHATGAVTSTSLAARLSLLEPFTTGRATINLHYKMVDWDLGRSFLASKHLELRPSIGLKGGWISQMIQSDFATPNLLGFIAFSASDKIAQHFRGVGPKGGVTGKWYLGNSQKHSFSLIGKFEAGYLWGHWAIRDKFIDDLGTVISVKPSNRNFGSFLLRGFAGLGWDLNCHHDRAHFSIKLGYEIEDWLNQLQIYTNISGSQNNDLILQGLTAGARFDF
ncbi:MAG: Lpg1974 family pore-forming outer membrane protein [Chlamydiales bacterium]